MRSLVLAVALLLGLAAGPARADVEAERQAALAAFNEGRYGDALAQASAALARAEAAYGPDDGRVAGVLVVAGLAQQRLGDLAAAEASHRRALAIRVRTQGENHANVATNRNNLAEVLRQRGLYPEAEALHRRALAVRRAAGDETAPTAESLNNLGLVLMAQGRLAEAEDGLRRALAIRMRVLAGDAPQVATTSSNLGVLLRQKGDYAEATEHLVRAIDIGQRRGGNHPDLALHLNNLASVFGWQGLLEDSAELHRRALALGERLLGPSHPNVGLSYHNLAYVVRRLGHPADAEALHRKALAIRQAALGARHPDVALDLFNLAGLLREQRRYGEAEPLFREALAIRQAALRPGHHLIGEVMVDFGGLLGEAGRGTEGLPLLVEGIELRRATLGDEHPELGLAYTELGRLHAGLDRLPEALAAFRRASDIFKSRGRGGESRRGGAADREQINRRQTYAAHLDAIARVHARTRPPGERAALVAEAVQIAQLAQVSTTGRSIARMTARLAAGDPAVAALIRDRQAALDRLEAAEAQVLALAGLPGNAAAVDAIDRLRQELADWRGRFLALDDRLRARFPQYADLANPLPLTLDEIRGLLEADEAFALFVSAPARSITILVRRDRAELFTGELAEAEVARLVTMLRRDLDLGEWTTVAPPLDLAAAHALYRALLAPGQAMLAGARRLLAVHDGPLQSLPLAVLVTEPPPSIRAVGDYRGVAWLFTRLATSVLPSASSLRALRTMAPPPAAREPFVGFGDPRTDYPVGPDATTRGALVRRGDARLLEALRDMRPLPDTAAELNHIAHSLGAPLDRVYLAERATKPVLRSLDLARFKVIAFATHGLVARDVPGLDEPALLLTLPKRLTAEDNGLLTMSDVAGLPLDADWVLLSACNTAAPDGRPGAEGLSGLARSFFYAGSRALLVSHWPVESEAAMILTTRTFAALAAQPGLAKSEALRTAMLDLMRNGPNETFAHPGFWAPFVLVGGLR